MVSGQGQNKHSTPRSRGRTPFRRARVRLVFLVLGLHALLASRSAAQEEEEKKLGWAFTAEASGVWTGGNSESNTFGAAGSAKYLWPRSEILFEVGGTQTESTVKTRTAVGTPDAFQVVEEKTTSKTAELYYARGRYAYKITDRFFVYGGADWLRNTFAGIESRFLVAAGAGNAWVDNERMHFKTDYGVTYSFQEDVVENPFISANFPGLRLGYDFGYQLTSVAQFLSVFILDSNLDNTDDVRVDWINSLPISISETLAFKPSYQILWRNDPALTEIDLVDGGGVPTGETVLVPLEKLDTLFTLALVLKTG